MHSLKVNVFRMTLKEYGSFTWVERTYPALKKTSSFPRRCSIFLPPVSSVSSVPLSTYHLSRVVVLFYTLSKLFCFIVDFLTSNKVINQTKVFESVCLLKLLTPCLLFFTFHTLIFTLDGSSPVLWQSFLSLNALVSLSLLYPKLFITVYWSFDLITTTTSLTKSDIDYSNCFPVFKSMMSHLKHQWNVLIMMAMK